MCQAPSWAVTEFLKNNDLCISTNCVLCPWSFLLLFVYFWSHKVTLEEVYVPHGKSPEANAKRLENGSGCIYTLSPATKAHVVHWCNWIHFLVIFLSLHCLPSSVAYLAVLYPHIHCQKTSPTLLFITNLGKNNLKVREKPSDVVFSEMNTVECTQSNQNTHRSFFLHDSYSSVFLLVPQQGNNPFFFLKDRRK